MTSYIIAAVLLCLVAVGGFVQMRGRLRYYYSQEREKTEKQEQQKAGEPEGDAVQELAAETEEKEEKEVKKKQETELKYRKEPGDKSLYIISVLFTVINLAMMAVSYFCYKDNALYALKLAFVFQWIAMIAIIDYHCYTIPNLFIVEGLAASVVFAVVEIFFFAYPPIVCLKDYFFGFLIGAGVFLLSALLSRGSIGMGDVKLYATAGLLLGCVPEFQLMFYSVFVSAIGSLVVLISRKGNRKTMLPFAPFTCIGMMIVTLLGA